MTREEYIEFHAKSNVVVTAKSEEIFEEVMEYMKAQVPNLPVDVGHLLGEHEYLSIHNLAKYFKSKAWNVAYNHDQREGLSFKIW